MNDPHVERLRYRIEPGERVTFENPPELVWDTPECSVTLTRDEAVVVMKDHVASEETARATVEPLLGAYELNAAILAGGTPQIRFQFVRADIVDRNPPLPGSPQVIHVGPAVLRFSAPPVTVHVTRRSYPEPPARFSVSSDVEILWSRYQAHRRGEESLTSMAYFCLTVVEASVGPGNRRRRAAVRYNIHLDVLNHLGHLTSEVGDEDTARKWGRQVPRPHTGAEKAWINAAVLKLIHRLGDYAADPDASRVPITMQDLPQL